MAATELARWPDLLVMGINLAALVAIGWYCSRKTDTADSYFLADRSMPGWIVAFSMMATIISSMTFLALPGATFQDDWRFMPAHAMYFVPALAAYFVFMPFFRRGHISTAYEYLERRFGSWARIYGAVAFLFHHIFRTGIILYAVSLPFEQMSGLDMPVVIVGLGVLVAAYTIAGGLKAVIYTDLLQGIALIVGGLICIPILASQVPGGLSQIVQEASAAGKFGVGSTAWVLNEKTVWVIILVYQFQFLQIFCTDQSMVQRYLSIRSDDEARRGFILGTALTIPVWLYFAFVGTALFVYYQHHPGVLPDGTKPEGVFPYFILTQIPAGVAGFVIAGLLAAAMSTLDSSINASAGTVTNDFYRRFFDDTATPRHYLRVGRLFSILFSAIMICVALTIHLMRTETLMDVQTLVYPVVSAGLLSLFLLGFLTLRVGSRAAAAATIGTVLLVTSWLLLDTAWASRTFPALVQYLPNNFWIGVVPHLFLILVGYAFSFLWPEASHRQSDRLANLTIWTRRDSV